MICDDIPTYCIPTYPYDPYHPYLLLLSALPSQGSLGPSSHEAHLGWLQARCHLVVTWPCCPWHVLGRSKAWGHDEVQPSSGRIKDLQGLGLSLVPSRHDTQSTDVLWFFHVLPFILKKIWPGLVQNGRDPHNCFSHAQFSNVTELCSSVAAEGF